MIDRRWLFVCSCIALVTSAFTFAVRGDILQEMGDSFSLTQERKGGIEGAVFIGMALSMFFGGFVCDLLGIRRIMFLAFGSHLFGSLATIFASFFMKSLGAFFETTPETAYYWLYGSSMLMGCGNGFTEVGINPLIATLYPDKKTHYLNILHAWWPGGLVIGGLLAQIVIRRALPEGLAALDMWQVSLCLIALPAVVYGAMLLPARFPMTERVESGVSTRDMFKECARPLFLIWAICMLMTAATELGPQKWQESVMRSTANISGTLILVYTSGMMFILRHFAGPIAHRLSPVGMLTCSAALAGVGLFLLSYANDAASAFGYATIFGLGIAYFWPTMLGVTAERFPKGGALALALMGSVGNLSISQVLPQMGRIVDSYAVDYVEANSDPGTAEQVLAKDKNGRFVSVNQVAVDQMADAGQSDGAVAVAKAAQSEGYRMAFRWVSLLPAILIVMFGGIILYDRSRGGYKPEILISREEEDELFAGGVQAPVE
ncbi:MAG TPA: MFS transporter [Pirellulales bacterium]|nr:MFS transporter [Pirellulales bacterium]